MSFDYRDTPGDTDWFIHDRFGMFIHWGVYAAAGRHEWLKKYEQMTDEQYQPYFDHFDPDLYDPAQWACMAREAGMKYFVITTKHHDGCCMWDTALTDWAPETVSTPSVFTAVLANSSRMY
jgi:alpha-L-fucosidase